MRILFFMIAVLGFMAISQDTTYAQKKSKKNGRNVGEIVGSCGKTQKT